MSKTTNKFVPEVRERADGDRSRARFFIPLGGSSVDCGEDRLRSADTA